MAAKLHSITGTAYWAKLFERNRDKGEYHEATDGITSIDLLLDKEALDYLKKTGSRLRPRVTEEGVVVKFRRPWVHNSIEAFGGAPRVVNKDNETWDNTVSIGNGSEVEVFFSVYDTTKGTGTRMEGVRVLNHVEYEVPEDQRKESGIKLPF